MLLRWCLLLLFAFFSNVLSAKPIVKIGYQSMNGPFLYLAGSKILEQKTPYEIQWKKFESGSKVSLALASKDIDIAILGSVPLAVAIGQNIPIQLFWIAADIHHSEALIAHPKSAIQSIADLKGKKIATPFGSTAHFHLMVALQQAHISPTEVRLLNYAPSQIGAAWHSHAIDASFIWQPTLQELTTQKGTVLLRSADIRKNNGPGTFDGLVVRSEWAQKNPSFLKSFVQIYDQEVQNLRKNPQSWSLNSDYVRINAQLSGAAPEDVIQAVSLYFFPTQTEQRGSQWFGSATTASPSFVVRTLDQTSQFLVRMGFIRKPTTQWETAVQPIFP